MSLAHAEPKLRFRSPRELAELADFKVWDTCRACSGAKLETVLDLGELRVSGFPLPDEPLPPRAPLELVRCDSCTLVQLRHSVDRDALYRDRYWYRSGVNPAMEAALRDVVYDALECVDTLHDRDIVLDIGANDGTLLRQYDNYPTLIRMGYEPAANIVAETDYGGAAIFQTYYPDPAARISRPAKIITSIAMFYDLDDPNAFVAAIKRDLAPDGVWVCQMQMLEDMLDTNGFDNICHEHVAYWSVHAFSVLLARHGLTISAMGTHPINGGSSRFIIRHRPAPASLMADPAWEGAWRRRLADFAANVDAGRMATHDLLYSLKATGALIWGYAASTKANTLLQSYDLDQWVIGAFADRDPHKWGRRTVTGIPIVSEDAMRAARPDYLLLGAWQWAEQFAERERDLIAGGTKLIVPLPELRIIGGD